MEPYSGEVYPKCPFELRFSDPGVTFVVGGNANIFGHAMFRLGPEIGFIHVDQIYAYPKILPASSLPRYLREHGKKVFRQESIRLPYPAKALAHIEKIRCEKWHWFGIPHNCVAFCEEILQVGGAKWEQISNLPEIIALTSKAMPPQPPPMGALTLEGPGELGVGKAASFKAVVNGLPGGGHFDWSHAVGEVKDGVQIIQMAYDSITVRAEASSGIATLYCSYQCPAGSAYTSREIRLGSMQASSFHHPRRVS
jgi:hypothetical protein